MGTSQSTPTGEETRNGPEQDFVQDLFYYPPLNTPTSQTAPNRPVYDYNLQDPFSYPPMSTPTDQTPNGPVQGYLQDHFYYPPLSTPTDQLVQGNLQEDPLNYQTPNGPVQGYLQDPFYYPPLSTPTDQPPNRPVQGYLQEDPWNYPLMSTLTDQILNGPDQEFVQDLFYYPPLYTAPTPNQPVQDYLQEDPFNYPPLSTPTTSQTLHEPVQGDLEDPSHPPLVQTSVRKRMCCSCHGFEHVQPTKVEYINLGDGRYLCPKCLSVSLTEPKQLEPVIRQVHSFFDDYLKLPVKKDIPIFFVDGNEMNRHDANDGTEMVYGQIHYAKVTIKAVKRCIRRGAALEVATETKKVKGDKVAAILLLFGLPKHVVGAALVHEMVHAWIRLQGLRLQDWFFKWKKGVAEGLCEAASYEWLKYTASDYDPSYTEKEAKIVELLTTYFKSNIKECRFSLYPAEFRTAKCAFKKYGVKPTLKHFVRTRKILE